MFNKSMEGVCTKNSTIVHKFTSMICRVLIAEKARGGGKGSFE